MTNAKPADRLTDVLEPVVAGLGLRLYDVEVRGSGASRSLRVLIDRDGGVDLAAVTATTEALGPVLDTDPVVAAVLPGTYLLEVSSPGLERPLRTPAHYRAAIGSPISLKWRDADGAIRRDRVLLVGAADDAIEVDVDGARRRVDLADITQARTVFEWGPAPKPGKSGSRKGRSKPTVSAGYEDATR